MSIADAFRERELEERIAELEAEVKELQKALEKQQTISSNLRASVEDRENKIEELEKISERRRHKAKVARHSQKAQHIRIKQLEMALGYRESAEFDAKVADEMSGGPQVRNLQERIRLLEDALRSKGWEGDMPGTLGIDDPGAIQTEEVK